MSWQFWIIPLVIFWSLSFRRRWQRPRRPGQRHRRVEPLAAREPELVSELETQRDYIGALESRVAELENRLDFTERLLSTRSGSAPATG